MHVQLTFRELHPTIAIEHLVFQEAHKLDQLFPFQIDWCHVVIEQPHRHHHNGRPFRVHLTLQGRLGAFSATNHEAGAEASSILPTAIADAFHVARRQLRKHARAKDEEHREPLLATLGRLEEPLWG